MPIGSDYYVIPRVLRYDRNPSVIDDVTTVGSEIGQYWQNTLTGDVFRCMDNIVGQAKWYTCTFQIDPVESSEHDGTIPNEFLMPNYQTDIDSMADKKTFLVTPEILYTNREKIINYDLTIPTEAQGTSLGLLVSIGLGYTVTVNGSWSITH